MRDGEPAWHPAECDVSIRPGWFYHEREDSQVKSLATLADIYFKSVGRNSVLLLNIPPDQRGRFADPDVARLRELGAFVKELYATDHASDAVTKADSQRDTQHGSSKLLDGNLESCWAPAGDATSGSVEFHLPEVRTFNVVRIQEDITQGERVQAYRVEIREGDTWRAVAAGQVMGHKQLLRIAAVTAQHVRLVIERAAATPAIAEFGLHWNSLAPAGSGALTAHRPATASDVHPAGTQYGADKAVDDDPNTRWATSDEVKEAWLEVDLLQPVTIERLIIKELDPRLTKYELQYRAAPEEPWRSAYQGTSAGIDFETSFSPVTARYVRLQIFDATLPPTIWEFQVMGKRP